ncbi:hypothetical protein EJB05_21934 [Eragrostis curvula]|uniref:Uncharacterized protein n=1 Tax=Eragrostis curvula TaxID=38414 RepID=A0A5J9V4Q7_9POAL|nr:hypothetical protein EJB05_21934 [Eragrostis curvula]
MEEACTVLHAENKRSLPAWMLKSCSDNQVVKTEDQNAKTSESDEQTRNLDLTKSVKRNTGRRIKQVDLVGAGELGVLRLCEGRAKARKTSKNVVKDGVEEMEEVDTGWRLGKVDSAGDGELGVMRRCTAREKTRRTKNIVKDEVKEIEEVASKNLRKVSEGAVPKNRRIRKLENAKSEASSPKRVDDEIELTVEDLISIAKEYVNADEQKQRELENVNTARGYEDTSCHTISTECTTITRNTSRSELGCDENSSHQELHCSSSFKMTGDVYQDMLNLFLCPLLSKPASYLKEPEPIESVATTIYHVPEKKECRREVPSRWNLLQKRRAA